MMIPGPNVLRQLARCGFKWILIDMEHGNIDGMHTRYHEKNPSLMDIQIGGAMHDAVAAIGACGASPVVRVAANECWMVKRA